MSKRDIIENKTTESLILFSSATNRGDGDRAVEIGASLDKFIEDVIFQYSEWLDADQGLVRGPGWSNDQRSHEELVNDFLASGR